MKKSFKIIPEGTFQCIAFCNSSLRRQEGRGTKIVAAIKALDRYPKYKNRWIMTHLIRDIFSYTALALNHNQKFNFLIKIPNSFKMRFHKSIWSFKKFSFWNLTLIFLKIR